MSRTCFAVLVSSGLIVFVLFLWFGMLNVPVDTNDDLNSVRTKTLPPNRGEEVLHEKQKIITNRPLVSRRINISELSGFLESRKREPMAYAAAFDLTSDPSIIYQGLEKWPNSLPLLVRLLSINKTDGDKMATADKLVECDSKNSLGYYVKAGLLLKNGDFAKAIEFLGQGNSQAALNLQSPEEVIMRREAWGFLGVDEYQAKIRSMSSVSRDELSKELSRPFTSVATTLETEPQSIGETLALNLIGYAERLRQSNSRSVTEEIVALSFQNRLLANIDPTFEFGETGYSVQEYRKKIASELQSSTDFAVEKTKVSSTFSKLENGIYADTALSLGEVAAFRQLQARRIGK